MLALQWSLWLRTSLRRLAAFVSAERGAEVPEYVLVVAIVAMLAVIGLVAVKNGLLSNLNGISNCLQSAASGTAASCN